MTEAWVAVTRALGTAVREAARGPLLVHADLLRAGSPLGAGSSRDERLRAHAATLSTAAPADALWLPAFNYTFATSGAYDVRADVSQLGPLTEFFRTEVAKWRTSTPIFSFAGTGPIPPNQGGPEIDPFGTDSAFGQLAHLDGGILFYGASLSSGTIIHHAERAAGGPQYRYDKLFRGRVILPNGSVRPVALRYHVRPVGRHLDYDWSRLEGDLWDAGLVKAWRKGIARFMVISARRLVEFWVGRLARDPLYLLDPQSRAWVEPMLHHLGRRFLITDFEVEGQQRSEPAPLFGAGGASDLI